MLAADDDLSGSSGTARSRKERPRIFDASGYAVRYVCFRRLVRAAARNPEATRDSSAQLHAAPKRPAAVTRRQPHTP